MFLGIWEIDDLLTFYANTHNATTGAAVDADSAPSYRIYENETTTPIVTGTMALLDASNTDGFYSEQVTLSAANGFENGKCYCIRIQGVVSSVTGAKVDTFQVGYASEIANSVASSLAAQTHVTVTSTIQGDTITVHRGSSYNTTTGRTIPITIGGDTWPTDLTSWTITMDAYQTHDSSHNPPTSPDSATGISGVATTMTGDSRAVRIDLTTTITSGLTPGWYKYYVEATNGSNRTTLRTGVLHVVDDDPTT
jgi:hypothetical protein